MKRIMLFFSALLLLCATGCQFGISGPIVLTEKDSGSVVNVKTGDTVVIRLEGNPTTGYLWTTAVPDDTVVREIDNQYVPLKNSSKEQVGAPVMKVFTYVIVGPGDAGIKMEYKRPWESGKAPAKTFDIMLKATGESTLKKPEDENKATRRVGSYGEIEPR